MLDFYHLFSHKRLFGLSPPLLFAFSIASAYSSEPTNWVCDSGKILITITEGTAHVDLRGEKLSLSPLFKSGSVVNYGKTKPGTDDERVITERMLRLDESDGHLVYLENLTGEPMLINTECTPD